MRHDIFEAHEAMVRANANKARDAEADGDFDARHRWFGLTRLADGDEQVEREIGHERKRMRRVDR